MYEYIYNTAIFRRGWQDGGLVVAAFNFILLLVAQYWSWWVPKFGPHMIIWSDDDGDLSSYHIMFSEAILAQVFGKRQAPEEASIAETLQFSKRTRLVFQSSWTC